MKKNTTLKGTFCLLVAILFLLPVNISIVRSDIDTSIASQFTFTKGNTFEDTPAPDFTLIDIDGNNFTLSQHRGKVILIDFMATWCPLCHIQLSELTEVFSQVGDEIIMISIDIDLQESEEDLRNLLFNFPLSPSISENAHYIH